MALDAICMTAIAMELRKELLGGRIDKIYQPSRDEVVLLVHGPRGNFRLLLSASPRGPRAQITTRTVENPAQPPMFCMLLRKHLTGGRILEIKQPDLERVLIFELECTNELGDKVERRLVLEAMGRFANLILVDDKGRVTDCVRKVEGDLTTGKRQVLPGLFYHLPEPRPGLSPLLRRELEFRSGGPVDDEEAAARELTAKVEEGEYEPILLVRDGVGVDVTFMPILQYGPGTESHRYPTFEALLDDFYAAREQVERSRQRGADLLRAVTAARDRVKRKLASQTLELEKAKDRERLRQLGDLVTSNLHLLEKGMDSFAAADYYHPQGATATIPLDPLLTPQQNAAGYYRAYNKAKTAERVLTEQIEKGRGELDYLESVLETVTLAEGERDISEIRRELEETGYLRRPKASQTKKTMKTAVKPMEFRSTAGLRISVGKNNTQNDLLTTKQAGKNDIWLHTQKIHGSHVILWTEGREPDLQSLTEAAQLAAWFSQGRAGKKVPVDYTPVKFVKKPAGARPGMVVYTTYQTARVDPDGALADRLRVN